MAQNRISLLIAALAAVVTVLVTAGPAAAAPNCASRVLKDWQDGRLDGTYPVPCYRQALAQLPEDVRVYSSAQNDITRALQARLGTPRVRTVAARTAGHDRGISLLAVLGVTGAVLLIAGGSLAVVRR
ncbi:MAG TPA: hypothetical protein VIU81_10255 [Gaiellaceae bacterium]